MMKSITRRLYFLLGTLLWMHLVNVLAPNLGRSVDLFLIPVVLGVLAWSASDLEKLAVASRAEVKETTDAKK